jgi:hypothetical protein
MFPAIYQTAIEMGPYYIQNIYKWFKMALWDAPYRVILDIQLQQMMIERDLSRVNSH